MQSVDEFIRKLLVDKGITDLDPDTEKDLIDEMKEVLLDQINQAAILQLDEQKAAKLASLMDSPDFSEEKMTEFMRTSGVDLTRTTLETMANFRNSYLAQGETNE